MRVSKRTQEHMANCADRYQQRADECALQIYREERQDHPNGGLITMLEIHRDHWQSLAYGARSFANAYDAQDRAAHGAANDGSVAR
jgi:hypothetical protein